MMNTYTSNASEIIRQDFLRFSTSTKAVTAKRRVLFDADAAAAEAIPTHSLEELRAEMANDDGTGSFGSYKSSIF